MDTSVMIYIGLAIFLIFIALLGAILAFARKRWQLKGNPMAQKILDVLPQTQCGQCGFAGCKPYAQAIADGKATIDRCPPGGQEGVQKLAHLLGIDPPQLNAEQMPATKPVHEVAFIIEDYCIGCTRCLQACPVDAIIGSKQRLHTIVSDECTGCTLCVAPCPVDCIVMKPRDAQAWQWQAQGEEKSDV